MLVPNQMWDHVDVDALLLVARLVLAGIFVVAGITKLADLPGSRRAIEEFGLPARLAPALGLLLPVAELLTAVALVFSVTAWAGSIVAAIILVLFLVAISVNLIRGNAPDCHCFGQLHSEPIGPTLLVRNVILLVIAVFVAIKGYSHPGTSTTAWLGSLGTANSVLLALSIVLVVVTAVQASIMFKLLEQNGHLLLRVQSLESGSESTSDQHQGLPLGTEAPEFSLRTLEDKTVTLSDLRAHGKDVLLVFVSPGCRPCATLLPEIAGWQREHDAPLTVALMTTGSREANESKMADFPRGQVLLQLKDEVGHRYHYLGTPGAVIVSADGRIATPLVTGPEGVQALLEHYLYATTQQQATDSPVPGTSESRVGQVAPGFDLVSPSGKQVRLEDLRGREVALLFWSPTCGFCQSMSPELIAWMETKPAGTPDILVLSSSPVADTDPLERMGAVLLDPNGAVAQTYGVAGTPMGILIHADGTIASVLAVGASAIFQLLGRDGPAGELQTVPDHRQASNGNGQYP